MQIIQFLRRARVKPGSSSELTPGRSSAFFPPFRASLVHTFPYLFANSSSEQGVLTTIVQTGRLGRRTVLS